MKKTVEVEYVGIEDIQDIMDDVYALMREGHYVSIEMSNYYKDRERMRISIMLGGWDAIKGYDYEFEFYMSDREEDVSSMNKCKSILNNLLAEG